MMEPTLVEESLWRLKSEKILIKEFIADRDSSTQKVVEGVAKDPRYGCFIKKLNCYLHVIRNFNSAIMNVMKNTSIPIADREKVHLM